MELATLTVLAWEGELPRYGDFIASEKGRTAFKVVEIIRPRKRHAKHVARFRCERYRKCDVPEGSIVHCWVWGKR